VGGPTPGTSKEDEEPRRDTDLEPVAYHGDSPVQIQEDMHTFKLKGAIELTVIDETLCLEFLEKRKPWLGVVYTKEHAVLLRRRIVQSLWKKFTNEDSDHYKPGLAAILHKAGISMTPSTGTGAKKSKGLVGATPFKKRGDWSGRTPAAKRRRSEASAKKKESAAPKKKAKARGSAQGSELAIRMCWDPGSRSRFV